MTSFIDSHCHLDRLNYDSLGSLKDILARAESKQVEKFLCISTNLDGFDTVSKIAQKYPQVFCSAGVHPLQDEYFKVDAERLLKQAQSERVIAVGETGLDYFYSPENAQWQKEALAVHIEIAKQVNKPLIIHSRDARKDTLELLVAGGASKVGGILHCFTESIEMALAAIDLGFYISFSGILTFKSADSLRDVASQLPLDRILIETDCPWLTPVPFRGKDNQPVHVLEVARVLAEVKGVTLDEIAKATTENFHRLFPASL